MDNERIALGLRLKEAREYLGLSQQEVGDNLNLPRSAVSLMEAGQRKVEMLELKELAKIYGRPIGYFTGEEAVPQIPQDVAMLARQAGKLSDKDREELLRFTEFLIQRSRVRTDDGD
jgi:transcriptional regulator with XRE-family HTH domain